MKMRYANERGECVDDDDYVPRDEISSMTEEQNGTNAMDTEPNDLPLLFKYVEENDLENTENQESGMETSSISNDHVLLLQNECCIEGAKRDDEVGDNELVEINKDLLCPNHNRKKQNPRAVIQIPFKKKARVADLEEGDHGVVKRATVRVDSRQLHVLMRSGNDRVVKKLEKVQVFVRMPDLKHQEHEVKQEFDDSEGGEKDSVQILDIAPFVEKGIACPFVSSKRFHASMVEAESSEGEEHGGPTASDVFMEEVLRILRKPFDKKEYIDYREAFYVGSYFDYHQDVKRKLETFQHKQGKCLNILRGFFYWLQNLTREGAFQPWTDRRCLAIEPPSSLN